RQGTNVITDLDWQSPINAKFSVGIIDFVPGGNPTALKVHAVITKDLAGGAGTFALDGALNDFSIVFLASLEIKFTAFTFASRTGSKTDVNVHLDNGSPLQFDGALNDFSIFFLASLEIKFTAFTFASRTGSKTDVNVHLDNGSPIMFEGDLSFVEGLRKVIPPGVFGDGVSIDLIQNPLRVKAGLSLGLPPATVGA